MKDTIYAVEFFHYDYDDGGNNMWIPIYITDEPLSAERFREICIEYMKNYYASFKDITPTFKLTVDELEVSKYGGYYNGCFWAHYKDPFHGDDMSIGGRFKYEPLYLKDGGYLFERKYK